MRSDDKGAVRSSGTRKQVHLCCAGEATRLQQYELQVLGSSSTGYKPSSCSLPVSSQRRKRGPRPVHHAAACLQLGLEVSPLAMY